MADNSPSHWPITLTNSVAALFNIILPLALVRIFSPDQVGRYSVFFLYVTLCPAVFLVAGLDNGLYHWVGKYPAAKAEVRQSWMLSVVVSGFFSMVGLLFAHTLAARLKVPSLDLQLLFLSAPFTIAAGFLEDLLIARGSIWAGSFYSSGFNVLRAASILLAAWWGRTVEAVMWVFLAGIVLRTAVGWLLLSDRDELRWLYSKETAANVMRYALPVSIAALAGLAITHADQMILSLRLTPAAFAFFAMGCLAVPPLDIFETSVNRVLIPRLSYAFVANDRLKAARLFAEGVAELFCFLLPATMGLMIYAKPIVLILFTERYLPAAHFLRVYALYYLFLSFPATVVARARADGRWILQTTLIFAAVGIALTWFATGQWSAMGALGAVLASQLLMRIYSLGYIRRSLGVPFLEFFPLREMGIQTGLGIATAAVCSFLLHPLFSDPRMWLLVTGPLFTVVYFSATYAVSLRRHSNSSEPIHVIELAQTLGLGGLERMVYSLSHGLNAHERFKVLVATYDHGEGDPSLVTRFRAAGIPVIQWRKGKGFSLLSVVRLVQIIFSEKTRILHVHDLGPLVYGSLAKICSLGRVRLVLTEHSLLEIQKSRRYRLYYKFFLRFPDRVIAVSSAIQSGLLELGVPSGRVDVIQNGVSFSLLADQLHDTAGKQGIRKRLLPAASAACHASRWMLCLARMTPGKGQDVVLDVWNALPPDARAELSLMFVGQESQAGYAEALARRICTLPDHERILIIGPSERPEEWIQSSDIFISGSLHEGMPLAPLEAAGSGLPIILSKIEGHRFLEPWALSFDPGKPEEGAQKIVEILKTLKMDGDIPFFEKRWNATAPLRQQWGSPSMTASYVNTFQFS